MIRAPEAASIRAPKLLARRLADELGERLVAAGAGGLGIAVWSDWAMVQAAKRQRAESGDQQAHGIPSDRSEQEAPGALSGS